MIDFTASKLSDSAIVVTVSGHMTESNRKYFFDCISDLFNTGYNRVIIECSRIGYLDSSGLAALLKARKRAMKSGGQIYLTHVNSHLSELLEFTKLGRILSVFPTTEAALQSIEGEATCMA